MALKAGDSRQQAPIAELRISQYLFGMSPTNPPPVTLRQLRYFVAVAEELSFRRAAERLHITQPPLSRQIAEMESALGLPLLLRDTRRVRLTPAGVAALADIQALLRQVDATLARVAAGAQTLPCVRLGVMNWIDLQALGSLEQQLRRQGLASGLEAPAAASHESVAAVRQGTLDAALVAAPIAAPGLHCQVLGSLRLAAFVPASSALARRRRLSLQDLNAVPPFYRFKRSVNPVLYDHFAQQYTHFGFKPEHEAPAPEVMGVFAKIGAGRGCTCMPVPLAVNRYAGVVRRPLRETVTMDVALVWPPNLAPALRDALLAAAGRLLQDTHGV